MICLGGQVVGVGRPGWFTMPSSPSFTGKQTQLLEKTWPEPHPCPPASFFHLSESTCRCWLPVRRWVAGRYQRLIEDFEYTVGRDVSRARTAIKMLVGGHIDVRPKDGRLVAELHGSYEGLIELAKKDKKSPGSKRAGGTQVFMVAGARNCLNLLLLIKGVDIGPAAS